MDKEKNQCIRQKNGSTEHSKRNKTVPEKVATTCIEEGHRLPKQALQYKSKGRRNIGDRRRDWGTNFILRIKEQETRLTFHEHHDDDDDDLWYQQLGKKAGISCRWQQVSVTSRVTWSPMLRPEPITRLLDQLCTRRLLTLNVDANHVSELCPFTLIQGVS